MTKRPATAPSALLPKDDDDIPETKGARVSVRVGVIEIGSRATRLLVADVSNRGAEPALTRVEDTALMECVRRGESETRGELARISTIANGFRQQALRIGAERSFVFATEAIRQISDTSVFLNSPLASEIDEILDQRAEAFASLIAGVKGLEQGLVTAGSVLVIDQGAGSMELATGRCGPLVELLEYSSAKLGGNTLLQMLRNSRRDVESVSAAVTPILELCKLPDRKIDRVIIQGTAATKFAWLMERNNTRERYDAKRVHGTRLKTKVLEELEAAIKQFSPKNWIDFQDYVNPGEPKGDAGERLASGIIPLLLILHRLRQSEFVVSAHGTRHGIAWQISQPLRQQIAKKEPESESARTAGDLDAIPPEKASNNVARGVKNRNGSARRASNGKTAPKDL